MKALLGEAVCELSPLSQGLLAQGIDLEANAATYPELQVDIDPGREHRLRAVRSALLKLPLIHTTFGDLESAQRDGIQVFADRPATLYGHSNPLDESLGLTEYTFMHWGSAEKSPYGRNHIRIDPKLLLSPRTIVTPHDINSHNFYQDRSFVDTPESAQQNVRDYYFSKMVRGADWLEIVSRRVLASAEKGVPYTLEPQDALGEVKYHGSLPPDLITGVITEGQESDYWRQLLENGFVPGPVNRALKFGSRGYDPTPEDIGVSRNTPSEYWESLVVNA